MSNRASGRFVWGKDGQDTATLDFCFDEVGEECSEAITAISMDMGPAFDRSAGKEVHATKAVICYDPFRVAQLVTNAFDKVRRGAWQDLRQLPDQETARRFKDARWAMLKNSNDLTDDRAVTQRNLKRRAVTASDQVGGRFIVVDALDEDAGRFYERYGFVRCSEGALYRYVRKVSDIVVSLWCKPPITF